VSPKEYAAYLRKQAEVIPERVVMPIFRRRAFKVLELAVQNSPVNLGALRNGWHVTIGTASGEDRAGGKSPSAVLRAGQAVINKARFGEGVWIQNNVAYAPVWEHGTFVPPNPGPSKALHVPLSRRKTVAGRILVEDGFNVQAPNGMLGDAVQQVTELVKAGAL
jgi:hypothetical protein